MTDYLTRRVSIQTRERVFDCYPNNYHKVFVKKDEKQGLAEFYKQT